MCKSCLFIGSSKEKDKGLLQLQKPSLGATAHQLSGITKGLGRGRLLPRAALGPGAAPATGASLRGPLPRARARALRPGPGPAPAASPAPGQARGRHTWLGRRRPLCG